MTTEEQIADAVERCFEAVGTVWGEVFPDARGGDLPPEDAYALDRALSDALRAFLLWNTDLLDG